MEVFAGEPGGDTAAAPSGADRQDGGASSTPEERDKQDASSSKQGQEALDWRLKEAQAAVGKLPIEYLNEIAHILGRTKLNETASAKTATVARLLVECAPQHREALLAAMQAQLNL